MTPEDIRRIVVVEELDLSTDGRLAVVVRRSIKGDRYHGHLFAIDLDRRDVPRPRQLTRGAVRDTGPRLCPDGRTVAFVRTDPDRRGHTGQDRVARSGAARSPRPLRQDRRSRGRRRARVVARRPPPRVHRRGRPAAGSSSDRQRPSAAGATPTRKPRETPSPRARRITRADWRWDGEGHRDRWTHLFVVDWGDGRPRQVTSGDWGVSDIAWHPDGKFDRLHLRPRP